MLDRLESGQTFPNHLIVYVHGLCRKCSSHRIVYIVLSSKSQFLEVHVAFILLESYDHSVAVNISTLLNLSLLGERKHLCLHHDLVEMVYGDLVIRAEYEAVFARHVAGDAELRLDIILHHVSVSVEMVRSDVRYDGYIGLEVIHIVQLEAAELQHVYVELLGRHLIGVALSYVSAQTDVKSGLAEKMIYERGGGRLAVASGYADLLCLVISSGKFYL